MHEVKIHYEITKTTPTWGRYKTCQQSVLCDVITSEVLKGANLEAVDEAAQMKKEANALGGAMKHMLNRALSGAFEPSVKAPVETPSHFDNEAHKAKFLQRIEEIHAILEQKGIKAGTESTESILQRQHEEHAADKSQREKALLKKIDEMHADIDRKENKEGTDSTWGRYTNFPPGEDDFDSEINDSSDLESAYSDDIEVDGDDHDEENEETRIETSDSGSPSVKKPLRQYGGAYSDSTRQYMTSEDSCTTATHFCCTGMLLFNDK
jgi:hypothetical protein